MKPISIRYLSGPDVAALALTDHEILAAIETSLRARGEGDAVIESRMHLVADETCGGHFNVLRGYIAPTNTAGIKVVANFDHNYRRGLPSANPSLNRWRARRWCFAWSISSPGDPGCAARFAAFWSIG